MSFFLLLLGRRTTAGVRKFCDIVCGFYEIEAPARFMQMRRAARREHLAYLVLGGSDAIFF